MTDTLSKLIQSMPAAIASDICVGIRRGIEKENVRIDAQAHYSMKPHPQMLGSALMNPVVTTDFSESLIEMVTPICDSRESLFASLESLNQSVMHKLADQDELLWPYSMPYLPDQLSIDTIPFAYYGESFSGQMKTIYRRGLAQRYGKAMQMIAGIHYNISWPDVMFEQLQAADTSLQQVPFAEYKSNKLMGLVRNFLRQQWLCPFLFGVSPACFSGSLLGRPSASNLQSIDDAGAWAGVCDTSLRLSNVGYHNPYQGCVRIDYQDVHHYAKSLLAATKRPMPAYEKLILRDQKGNLQQLNANILQVENEFYSMIRPKSDQAKQGRPAKNLCKHGVAYVELRGLDLDPTTPLGITPTTSAFCDLWLTYLLLQASPDLSKQDQEQAKHDLNLAVYNGRACGAGEDKTIHRALSDRAHDLLSDMHPLAEWMDQHDAKSNGLYRQALKEQIDKTRQPAHLPAAKLMQSWKASQLTFKDFILQQAVKHRDAWIDKPIDQEKSAYFSGLAKKSLSDQQALESTQTGSFEDYLKQQLT
jgi:glutamate--cysteine ligase